jgi:hypothetical protein
MTRPQFATAKAWAESGHADPCDFKIEPNGIRVALDRFFELYSGQGLKQVFKTSCEQPPD